MKIVRSICHITFSAALLFTYLGCKERDSPEIEARRLAEAEQQREKLEAQRKVALEEREALFAKFDELRQITPPVKLAMPPYFKGKGVYVTISIPFDYYFYIEDLIGKEQRAEKLSEVETIIQVKCSRGQKLSDYCSTDEDDRLYLPVCTAKQRKQYGTKTTMYGHPVVSVYASKCEVSVIDYTMPAIIARRTFVNAIAPRTINEGSPYLMNYIIGPPANEIRNYVAGLTRR
jgi:hypothetical protein